MLENGSGFIRSVSDFFPVPSVIRLSHLVKRPRIERKLTRIEIFNRDQYICQYCGKATKQLTLDHVLPKYRNGQHIWENVVSACVSCNRRKAGKTPAEARMKLIHQPSPPHKHSHFYIPHHHLQIRSEWGKYLPTKTTRLFPQ